jgi:hypothetical protein
MSWDEDFEQLKKFYDEHGHSDVPSPFPPNPELALFVNKMRLQKRILGFERIRKLDSLDFRWKPTDRTWRDSLEKLRQFVEKHGHSDVPPGWVDDPNLSVWLETQRIAKRKGALQVERVQRLQSLGVSWGTETPLPPADIWQKRYDELKSYKEEHGNCNVPTHYRKNPALGSWVTSQRRYMKNGQLSPDKVRLLEDLNFEIGKTRSKPQADWDTRFAELCDYKKKYGNCSVPRDWDKNPQLGSWVSSQKQYIRKGTLSPDKRRRLEEIGFFDPEEGAGELGAADDWEDNFAALKSFKTVHGHCKVPIGWPDDPELGAWVMSQRLRLQTLPIERARRLRALGI